MTFGVTSYGVTSYGVTSYGTGWRKAVGTDARSFSRCLSSTEREKEPFPLVRRWKFSVLRFHPRSK